MNIAPSITLNAEQQSALSGMLADYNAGKQEADQLTEKVYLETVLMGLINERVQKNFKAVADQLVTAAQSMPYEDRLDLIATVQSKLP